MIITIEGNEKEMSALISELQGRQTEGFIPSEEGSALDSCKFTRFGLCVKTKLLEMGKSQKWLEEQIREKTGLFADGGYLYKILTGERSAPRIVRAITEILDIPES